MIDRVGTLIADVIDEEVLPRFRALRVEDIHHKSSAGDPEDVVTVVDQRVEAQLATRLAAVLPGSVVVGEEAVHARPALLDALGGSSPVWLVDPLDGTKNFARGDAGFGVMVALVERGAIRAAWIALPVTQQLFVAELGGGAFVNDVRLRCSPSVEPPRGTVYTRFMPPQLATDVERHMADSFTPLPGSGSAAIEYTSVVQAAKDFVVYYRLEPWDHAAGALVIAEAGGCVHHLDGASYVPSSPSQTTVVASSATLSTSLRRRLSQ